MATYYTTCGIYIKSAKDLRARLARIDAVIDALESSLIRSADNTTTNEFGLQEYDLDDGQTKITTIYRSPSEIVSAIKTYQTLRDLYEERLSARINGRVVRLVDSKNFTGGRRC